MKPTLSIVWMKRKPRILITSGEPAGIGPDLVIKISQIPCRHNLTIVADPDLLLQRAASLSIRFDINIVSAIHKPVKQATTKKINVLPVKLATPTSAGTLNIGNAGYVLKMLDIACDQCLSGNFDAMVTAPLQKSIINDAGISFSGHTEYLARRCHAAYPVMLLACPELRVALVTTHLPLRNVADAITEKRVETVIRVVLKDMYNRFGISNPHIAVCGLNPHAGENGHLGDEENKIITPVIKKFKEKGYQVSGPLPADTVFRLEQRQNTDVFICMYHDQGLPVLKTLGFGEAVNITLGLPIIRTSVDHGTALELAATGKAQCNSLLAAIDTAASLATHQINKSAVSAKSTTPHETV